MEGDLASKQRRGVVVHTVRGPIDGWLTVGARTRTSDHLNLACSHNVILDVEGSTDERWTFERGVLGVRTSAVLFIVESTDAGPISDARIEASRFTRAAVRLQVGDFQLEGYLHLTALSDPISRLSQSTHSFVPLTSASVVGPDKQFATSFLAFNPRQLLAVQPIDHHSELQALSTGDYVEA